MHLYLQHHRRIHLKERNYCEQRSLEAIADSITHEYQVDHNTAGEHVLRFLIQLQRQGIIERKEES